MRRVIGGKSYDTETATLVASNRYWDGSNYDRSGRNTYLYKTKKGNYFLHHTTMWTGEFDRIEPLSEGEAMEWWEKLPEQEVEYEEVFGTPEEA